MINLSSLLTFAQTSVHSLGQAAVQAAPAATAGATGASSSIYWAYAIFIGIVLLFLALDLGVFHRDAHEVSIKEATIWSVIWVSMGVAFTGLVYLGYEHHYLGLGLNTPMFGTGKDVITGTVEGSVAAKQYITGYFIEKSLAMDNIFVIAIIFSAFGIPNKYQHRVLFWGIIGALIMRGIMIAVAGELIKNYMWILIIFGAFLILTAGKMALSKGESDPAKNPLVKLARKMFPVVTFFDGQKFFTKRTVAPTYTKNAKGIDVQDPAPAGTLSAKWAITPLFFALIMVEITDLVFAVDSIPAIFAITPDPFIVFTSNILAILGLRSLYFCLAALIAKFRFLKPALILILLFVGVKLLLLSVPPYLDVLGKPFGWAAHNAIKIDTTISLAAVLGLLGGAVLLSWLIPAKNTGVPAKH